MVQILKRYKLSIDCAQMLDINLARADFVKQESRPQAVGAQQSLDVLPDAFEILMVV